jgi:glycosyltransferase involved in cell wall biosynthesis
MGIGGARIMGRKDIDLRMSEYRVLHLIDHLSFGGAQRIVAGIVSQRPDDFVFPLRRKGNDPLLELTNKLISPQPKYLIAGIPSILNLPSLIRENDIQLVHSHLRVSWMAALLLSRVMKSYGCPKFIFHEHGWILFGSLVYNQLVKLAARRGKIIVVSELIKEELLRVGVPASQMYLIYNFVDTDQFKYDARIRKSYRKELGLKDNQFLVGFAGRYIASKGWENFLDAAELLRDRAEYKFILVGSGPDAKEIDRQIKSLNLENKVVSLGHVKTMNPFYNAVDAFVNLSTIEASGLVQLEAQACGTPVIVSDTPGLRETVDNELNALLVPPGNVHQLVEAIQNLKEDRALYDSLAAAGYKNAAKFSLDRYMEKLSQVYAEYLRDG